MPVTIRRATFTVAATAALLLFCLSGILTVSSDSKPSEPTGTSDTAVSNSTPLYNTPTIEEDSERNVSKFALQSERRRLEVAENRPLIHPTSSLPLRGNPFSDERPTDASIPFRILHIVTTLSDKNNGSRGTVRGEDRYATVLVPTLVDAVQSMTGRGWHVDVVLILGFDGLAEDRLQLISKDLPEGVRLEVWEDASPLGYDKRDSKVIKPITRALARQHRYVIRDLIDNYDFFSVWEDDMRINAHHIDQYLKMSAEIDRLTSLDETVSPEEVEDPEIFNGPMTARQLRHAIPGFIRVEVMSSDTAPKDKYDSFARTSDVGIPVRETAASLLDADKCCGSPEANARLPSRPEPRDLMTWECALQGLAVRKFPGKIGWAALLPGPRQGEVKRRGMDPVHGFWTGSGGVFGADVKRPSEREPKFFSQQGGWMATRDQIIRFDEICTEGFLPPFKKSTGIKEDGLDPRQPHNVEFWSGGFQLFGTCNIQRIISMEPEHFSRQLLYHSSNNKQKTIAKERLKSVRDLYGQLATVVQTAEAKLESRVQ